ncbi:MAG: hypothetical protein HRT71_03830 [Flavobacteriales bacterium]|nr:hypothetical protein [Flavobacteriales bacterium]
MKTVNILIIILGILAISFVSEELVRKDVLDGDMSMLIPKDFIHIKKEEYIPSYSGEPKPDDYYCNNDTTIEISFMSLPKRSDDLNWCKAFSESAFLIRASNTYFNDTLTINSTKVHLTEFESTFKGKETYSKMFFINLKTTTVIGNISCDLKLKEEWMPKAALIFESIKSN